MRHPGYAASLAVALFLNGCDHEKAPSDGAAPQVSPQTASSPATRAPAAHGSIVRAPWGSAIGELGHRRPAEAMPECPMAFAIDSRGRIHVLDQVNSRIAVFENGKATHTVPIPGEAYQDIAIDARDRVVILDRLATSTVAVLDDAGAVLHSVPIVGQGLTEGGAATALFVFDDAIWIESAHENLVRVSDVEGTPDRSRTMLAGRPSMGGTMRARLAGPMSIAVNTDAWQTKLDFPMRVTSIRALESDGAGRVYLAAHLLREQPALPFAIEEERQVVVVLSPSGEEVSRVDIAVPITPDEQFRPIRVGADGTIYQLVCHEDAASIERFLP